MTLTAEKKNKTDDTLLEETNNTERKICETHYTISHQYLELTKRKENLNGTEAIIHADFSENYNGKLAREIQSMHFGGNRCQVSLHCVVVFLKTKAQSYCTVSDNTLHRPGAICSQYLGHNRRQPWDSSCTFCKWRPKHTAQIQEQFLSFP